MIKAQLWPASRRSRSASAGGRDPSRGQGLRVWLLAGSGCWTAVPLASVPVLWRGRRAPSPVSIATWRWSASWCCRRTAARPRSLEWRPRAGWAERSSFRHRACRRAPSPSAAGDLGVSDPSQNSPDCYTVGGMNSRPTHRFPPRTLSSAGSSAPPGRAMPATAGHQRPRWASRRAALPAMSAMAAWWRTAPLAIR